LVIKLVVDCDDYIKLASRICHWINLGNSLHLHYSNNFLWEFINSQSPLKTSANLTRGIKSRTRGALWHSFNKN